MYILISKIVCMLCAFLFLCNGASMAETVEGDLSERFGDRVTLKYNDTGYCIKQRMTTLLFLGLTSETDYIEQTARAAFLGIIVVDDDAKTISMIQVPSKTEVQSMNAQVLLEDVYGMLTGDTGCMKTLEAVNEIFPEPLIEDYLALDMAGLKNIDGFTMPDTHGMDNEAAIKTSLKASKHFAEEECTSDDIQNIITSLSDYTITEMKTGVIMKIADKSERYEILPTIYLAGEYVEKETEMVFVPDTDKILEQVISVFYEESFW